jgi:hypothetical protein
VEEINAIERETEPEILLSTDQLDQSIENAAPIAEVDPTKDVDWIHNVLTLKD